ncbi:MAG: alpha-E domain-containing protein [Oscillospiraceae bacterium]
MGTISIEHGDRLFWLGRYSERAFMTIRSLIRLYDKVIDKDRAHYVKYLDCFGLPDIYGSSEEFFDSFVYDASNCNSIAFSLEKAYDNGIVLREEISTEALAFLQLAMDKLAAAKAENASLGVALMPVEDILFGFFGCIHEYVYDEEIKNIILCGKDVERLSLLIRLKYKPELIEKEYGRLCTALGRIPANTPYHCNLAQLDKLGELIGQDDGCHSNVSKALDTLGKLFDKEAVLL